MKRLLVAGALGAALVILAAGGIMWMYWPEWSPEEGAMAIEVIRAPAGQAVDLSEPITDALLDALANRDVDGIIRYVPLPGVNPHPDISPVELGRILAHPARFWSCFVQHPRYPGWKPREHDPDLDALHAAQWAKAAGYPEGVTGYVDMEGMSPDTTAEEASQYAARWSHALTEQGFIAGIYCGFDNPMSPQDLYDVPDAHTYWSDEGNRHVAVRGTAVLQGAQYSLLGVPLDPDTVRPDQLGETPYVVRTAA